MTASVTVLETGLLTTVQDAGRPGQASLGVGPSGACDLASYRLANRLVGNAEDAAVLEVTYGGLRLRADGDVVVVTTGARGDGSWHHNAPTTLRSGDELVLGVPTSGLRTYVAVRGGFDVDPVLGSCATDTMSGLGPDVLSPGDVLAIGTSELPMPGVDLAPVTEPEAGDVTVLVTPGPRRDWFPDEAWACLVEQPWTVTSDSNRIGLRLDGEALERKPDRRAAQRGPGPRRTAGAAVRQAGAVPGRPSGDGRLPGDRVRRGRRRGPLRAAPPRPAAAAAGDRHPPAVTSGAQHQPPCAPQRTGIGAVISPTKPSSA